MRRACNRHRRSLFAQQLEAALRAPDLFFKALHAALERGVYLAPSAYEAGFLSTAHDGPAITKACEVLTEAIRRL